NYSSGLNYITATEESDIVWKDLDPRSYDENLSTGAGVGAYASTTFSWEGNLHEKVISLYFVRWSSSDQPSFTVLDENNQPISFYRLDTQSVVSSLHPMNLRIDSGYTPVKSLSRLKQRKL